MMRKTANVFPESTPIEQVKIIYVIKMLKNVFDKTEERVHIMNEFDFEVANNLLPTSQPSEDARLARRQLFRAVRWRKKARVFVW